MPATASPATAIPLNSAPADARGIAAWDQVHGARDLQFAPLPPWHRPPPPAWLKSLSEFLEWLFGPVAHALGVAWPVLEWIIYGLLALGLLLLAWRIGVALWSKRPQRAPEAQDWAPDQTAARALLEEADALAAQGRYDEAAHLLLLRSFDHIADARPDWLAPASTAREIASLPALPGAARGAFARIAALVEQGRYALRPLAAHDWSEARAAYSGFALANLGSGLAAAGSGA